MKGLTGDHQLIDSSLAIAVAVLCCSDSPQSLACRRLSEMGIRRFRRTMKSGVPPRTQSHPSKEPYHTRRSEQIEPEEEVEKNVERRRSSRTRDKK